MPATPRKAKIRAARNRTLDVVPNETVALREQLIFTDKINDFSKIRSRVICGDALEILAELPRARFDLLFADPPYNLTKDFGKQKFKQRSADLYEEWLDSWLSLCIPLLKTTASVYICGDWRSGASIQKVGSKYLKLQNRITWEREKGRGARANWKNAAEDIWFFTVADKFVFNLEAVKVRRKVLAPYKENGQPKDWESSTNGAYRNTHPSNIWTDISIPFWSMRENTDHPTQKSEKLLAKIILASTNRGDLILDPFAGSGTTAVTAKKLGRDFVAIESDEKYCLLTQKRLEIADGDKSIQGFSDGVFWERNSGKK